MSEFWPVSDLRFGGTTYNVTVTLGSPNQYAFVVQPAAGTDMGSIGTGAVVDGASFGAALDPLPLGPTPFTGTVAGIAEIFNIAPDGQVAYEIIFESASLDTQYTTAPFAQRVTVNSIGAIDLAAAASDGQKFPFLTANVAPNVVVDTINATRRVVERDPVNFPSFVVALGDFGDLEIDVTPYGWPNGQSVDVSAVQAGLDGVATYTLVSVALTVTNGAVTVPASDVIPALSASVNAIYAGDSGTPYPEFMLQLIKGGVENILTAPFVLMPDWRGGRAFGEITAIESSVVPEVEIDLFLFPMTKPNFAAAAARSDVRPFLPSVALITTTRNLVYWDTNGTIASKLLATPSLVDATPDTFANAEHPVRPFDLRTAFATQYKQDLDAIVSATELTTQAPRLIDPIAFYTACSGFADGIALQGLPDSSGGALIAYTAASGPFTNLRIRGELGVRVEPILVLPNVPQPKDANGVAPPLTGFTTELAFRGFTPGSVADSSNVRLNLKMPSEDRTFARLPLFVGNGSPDDVGLLAASDAGAPSLTYNGVTLPMTDTETYDYGILENVYAGVTEPNTLSGAQVFLWGPDASTVSVPVNATNRGIIDANLNVPFSLVVQSAPEVHPLYGSVPAAARFFASLDQQFVVARPYAKFVRVPASLLPSPAFTFDVQLYNSETASYGGGLPPALDDGSNAGRTFFFTLALASAPDAPIITRAATVSDVGQASYVPTAPDIALFGIGVEYVVRFRYSSTGSFNNAAQVLTLGETVWVSPAPEAQPVSDLRLPTDIAVLQFTKLEVLPNTFPPPGYAPDDLVLQLTLTPLLGGGANFVSVAGELDGEADLATPGTMTAIVPLPGSGTRQFSAGRFRAGGFNVTLAFPIVLKATDERVTLVRYVPLAGSAPPVGDGPVAPAYEPAPATELTVDGFVIPPEVAAAIRERYGSPRAGSLWVLWGALIVGFVVLLLALFVWWGVWTRRLRVKRV